MTEKLKAEPKQAQTFFDALAALATDQAREAGEFHSSEIGKPVKAERKGRNPATGEEIKIAAKALRPTTIVLIPRSVVAK